MPYRPGLVASAVVAALTLGACGASPASPSAAAPASGSPAASPPTSSSPSQPTSPVASAAPSSGVSFAAGVVPDLEAALPTEAGGVRFTRQSFSGAAADPAAVQPENLAPLLRATGRTVRDVSLAYATAVGAPGALAPTVAAIRVRGATPDALSTYMRQAGDVQPVTIAGKAVLRGGPAGAYVYAYPKGDTLFQVLFADEDLAAAVFAKLP